MSLPAHLFVLSPRTRPLHNKGLYFDDHPNEHTQQHLMMKFIQAYVPVSQLHLPHPLHSKVLSWVPGYWTSKPLLPLG